MKVTFKLAEGFNALRHALPGGDELALDGSAGYATDDPREIAALDLHPAAERVKAVRKPRKPSQKAAAGTAASATGEEASA